MELSDCNASLHSLHNSYSDYWTKFDNLRIQHIYERLKNYYENERKNITNHFSA